ncbi:RNA polymerase factor sigma-54 [Salinisphaera sp. Q1T1-3]|uniref:RNA polymerase factor sigma-54 n=1 Tax=Salinisphaera sp. Q1T1-3 TaxID=2321229 RepID=UPI000E7463F1|nr:RNA polymerase factor sigma-54 [Salinisphaera sp. Q1T1-3]RJS92277.1 RNA polymerase factor sigma-54 [Salinisphaera sp. Q1T1-3]
MKLSQGLNLGQTLTMTPALQQAIRMLQLSTLDLKTEIQDALESNVMLEADEGHEEIDAREAAAQSSERTNSSDAEIPENLPVDADWNDIYAGSSAPAAPAASSTDDEDYWAFRQANLTSTPDLHAHLVWQADMHSFSPGERAAAEVIIDAIDANGLLLDWDEIAPRIAADLELTPAHVEAVLTVVQDFDPPGVAARSLAECLDIQLTGIDSDTPGHALARRLIREESLACLAEPKRDAVAARLGVELEALDTAIALIQTLQPHPGDAFAEHEADYVVPEVFVTRTSEGWHVALNPDIAPRLRINAQYLALIKRADKSADQTTLKSHLQEARFFLNSLKSRNDTLLEVAQCIVEAQRGFLEYGEEAMKPLVLRDVAEELEIHESTVSRATANKYMQTSRGVFELKYFFSSHVSTTDGGSASATAIQAMIKRMVAGETARKPLSDSKLAELLLDNGIQVARRTVAKYREALSIPPSHERRQKTG